jgi:hypothetical protein
MFAIATPVLIEPLTSAKKKPDVKGTVAGTLASEINVPDCLSAKIAKAVGFVLPEAGSIRPEPPAMVDPLPVVVVEKPPEAGTV